MNKKVEVFVNTLVLLGFTKGTEEEKEYSHYEGYTVKLFSATGEHLAFAHTSNYCAYVGSDMLPKHIMFSEVKDEAEALELLMESLLDNLNK